MEIIRWRDKDHKGKRRKTGPENIMVRMNQSEALRFAISILHQVHTGYVNSGRFEHYSQNGEYFSIAVHQDPQLQKPQPDSQEFLGMAFSQMLQEKEKANAKVR